MRLGVALCQVWYFDGSPVLSTELSSVTEDADPAAFRVDPAPGTRVITGTGPLAESDLSPAALAWEVAKAASSFALDVGKRLAKGRDAS